MPLDSCQNSEDLFVQCHGSGSDVIDGDLLVDQCFSKASFVSDTQCVTRRCIYVRIRHSNETITSMMEDTEGEAHIGRTERWMGGVVSDLLSIGV